MTTRKASRGAESMKPDWMYYLLILLIIEKIIQHVVVTLAFYFNWRDIGFTVVVSPDTLMILGAIVAVLFIVSLWGMVRKQRWAVNLIAALALFDILGEFVAQGTIMIVITVSFVVALSLLFLSLSYRHGLSVV